MVRAPGEAFPQAGCWKTKRRQGRPDHEASLPPSRDPRPAAGGEPAAAAGCRSLGDAKSVRQSLVDAGPTGAGFVQTYIPAGFSSGEKESGRLALSAARLPAVGLHGPLSQELPALRRRGPRLERGGQVRPALPGGPQERARARPAAARRRRPQDRYQATAKAARRRAVEIALLPKEKGKKSELTDATLTVDPGEQAGDGIAYHDREGNLTRFEITGYQDLPRQGRFSPPAGIRWEDQ